MPRKVEIKPVDMCKVLIGDLTLEELESVIAFAKYTAILKKREKAAKAKAAQGGLLREK
jgi:hypothetical protein